MNPAQPHLGDRQDRSAPWGADRGPHRRDRSPVRNEPLDWSNDPWASDEMLQTRRDHSSEDIAAKQEKQSSEDGADAHATESVNNADAESSVGGWGGESWIQDREDKVPTAPAASSDWGAPVNSSTSANAAQEEAYFKDDSLWPNSAGDGEVCSSYQEGKCRRGEECKWLHTNEHEQQQEGEREEDVTTPRESVRTLAEDDYPEEDEKETPVTSADRGESPEDAQEPCSPVPAQEDYLIIPKVHGCYVRLGPASSGTVGVRAPSDSDTVVLSDLPLDTSEVDLRAFITFTCMAPAQISLRSSDDEQSGLIADVMFHSKEEAAMSVRALHRAQFQSAIIRARIGVAAQILCPTEVAPSSFVCVTWKPPTKMAFANFPNAGQAKQAAKLDGKTFNGRRLSVEYVKAKKNEVNYAVRILDLPIDADMDALKELFKPCTSITSTWQTYDESPIPALRTILNRKGGPNPGMELLQPDAEHSDYVGIVKFSDTGTARYVVAQLASLHIEDPGKLLAKVGLSAKAVYHQRYIVEMAHFQLLKASVDSVTRQALNCTLRYQSLGQASVAIFLYGTDAMQVDRAKTALDKALEGHILTIAGDRFWHPAFDSPALRTLLLEIMNQDRTCFVKVDPRLRNVHLFGELDQAKKKLSRLLQERAKVLHMDIPADTSIASARGLVQRMTKAEVHVSLDVTSKRLELVTSADKESLVVERVAKELASLRGLTDFSAGECPFCFASPPEDTSIKLTCGHVYCHGCVEALLCPPQPSAPSHLRCVSGANFEGDTLCTGRIPIPVMHTTLFHDAPEQLNPDQLASVMTRLGNWFLSYTREDSATMLQFCPTHGCDVVHRRGSELSIQCPGCSLWICLTCWCEHDGLSCADHRDNVALLQI